MVRLIYIGRDFYNESSGSIGVLYTPEWIRSDWGRVDVILEGGEDVHIRPATAEEMGIARGMLKKYRRKP